MTIGREKMDSGMQSGVRERESELSFFDYVLPLRLTLILLLFYGGQGWQLAVPLRILCALGLLYGPWTVNAGIWLLITLVYVAVHSGDWFYIDNHKYLIGYWCFASVLAMTSADPVRVLRVNARWMIVVCFTLAVVWKVIGGEYLDGSFLHFKFLTDRRLQAVASWIPSLDMGDLQRNRDLLGVLAINPSPGLSIDLATTDVFRSVTAALSYWTLFIEGLVALLFLLPSSRVLVTARSVVLLLFVCTTYFFLPVSGFAFALVVIGYAQCPPGWNRLRLAHLLVLLLVEFTHIPWQMALTG